MRTGLQTLSRVRRHPATRFLEAVAARVHASPATVRMAAAARAICEDHAGEAKRARAVAATIDPPAEVPLTGRPPPSRPLVGAGHFVGRGRANVVVKRECAWQALAWARAEGGGVLSAGSERQRTWRAYTSVDRERR